MNKRFYLIAAALFSVNMMFAQEAGGAVIESSEEIVESYSGDTANVVEAPTDSLGIHPWDGKENDRHIIIPEQSHWSVFLGFGFNVFDGDYTSEKKHGVWLPALSLGATYHWNNTWAIGGEYTFNNYKVTGSGRECDADIMLKGMSHQVDAFVTFDIFNAFRPQNKKKLFALDLILGGGAFFKKNSIYYENVRLMSKILRDTPWDYNTATQPVQADNKYKAFGVFIGGMSAEFNINRSFQIGLRAIYNYTTSDEIDGRPYRGNNNDAIFDVEALVRYKFEPRKRSNVRNFMVPQIERWNDGTYYEDPAMGAAKRAKNRKAGAPVCDTIYSITRDTVWMVPAAGVGAAAVAEDPLKGIRSYVVFFENDVPELDKTAMSIAGEAAMLLMAEPDYNAVVVGSCDNTGAVEYNKWLATQRAINVSETLKGMGVDSSRIYMVGRGIMQDDREEGSFSINRRVEIRIVTDEVMKQQKDELSFFEQYKSVKRGSAVRQAGEGKNASSSEALKEAIKKMKEAGPAVKEVIPAVKEAVESVVNDVAPKMESVAKKIEQVVASVTPAASSVAEPAAQVEVLEKIIVPKDASLGALAKQYYGNANLWVKIFEANRDRLASPDQIQEGMELIIPKLNK